MEEMITEKRKRKKGKFRVQGIGFRG